MANAQKLRYLLSLLLFIWCAGQTNSFAVGVKKGLSLSTHHKIQEAAKLSESGKEREAITLLRQQLEKVKRSAYESAMVQQYLVHVYLHIDDLKSARDTAVKVYTSRQLPKQVNHSMAWLIAQVDFQREKYASSIKYLKPLLSKATPYSAKAHFLAGFSHYKLEQFKPAEHHIKQAMELEKRIPDNWYQVLLAIYMDRKRYSEAEPIVQTLIGRDPGKPLWWRYLVGIYMEQNREGKALAALFLAHYHNQLKTRDLMRIIHLYNYRGLPEKAARLLERWLREARLEGSYKMLKLQFRLWYRAHERSAAIEALNRAARLADSGEDYLLLGRFHSERSEWTKARENIQHALRCGVKKESRAQFLLGIAAYRSDDFDTARRAFEKASENPKLEQEIAYWVRKLRERSKSKAPS